MTTKADRLRDSASFAAAATPPSERRRLIEDITGETPAPAARTARLADLAHNPFNPRHQLGDLQETAESLLERGQIQPLTVVTRQAFLIAHPGQDGELGTARYVVIDGNRRLGAARLAGLDELRIDVNDDLATSATDILESALVANIQREDLSPLEEAEALAALVKVHGSQRQAARRIGKTHVWVSQRLALLDLTPTLQTQLRDGDITIEDARAAARAPKPQQAAAARKTKAARQARSKTRKPDGGGNAVSTAVPAPSDPGSGNGVSTPGDQSADPPGGNAVSTPPRGPRDWGDLPSLAAALRQYLSAAQLRELARLISAK